ncbi:hypothetical protein CLOLEP_02319 [[Clostridium] leptum DSM 753]|uniref:Uncharacterized protein n=1 Tax=[Clostridium] leptum DSM 753 TaxID=428125 RepID=A7VUS1_9FIRM|nr:hypothetical protein CLOLEP_02319 [[Clostridium] leptum DSM 753]
MDIMDSISFFLRDIFFPLSISNIFCVPEELPIFPL